MSAPTVRSGDDERERRRAARRLERQLLHQRPAVLLCSARDCPAVATRLSSDERKQLCIRGVQRKRSHQLRRSAQLSRLFAECVQVLVLIKRKLRNLLVCLIQ